MPTLESNYASGAPGSFFTLSATNLPSDSDVTLSVNGHDLGGDHTDGNGAATLILDAADATPGPYFCKLIWGGDGTGQAAVQSEGEVLVLIQVSPAAPLRAKEGDASVIAIPGGINGSQVMLPLIFR
jgi:hypothetical protein